MPPTTSLYIAFYNDPDSIYKHWALFIDGPTNADKTILNIMGSSTRYRFEMRTSNPRQEQNLLELFYLCDIDTSRISAIKHIAENEVVIHNEYPGYNCQDYVLEVLEELESRGIVDGDGDGDGGYVQKKKELMRRQEGLM
ncbi:hypothetical protein DTO164E3_6969 [Paecilomyces variotii]|nr:hypothetical protein DTO164E3_6969 [Paecilomyces variotii]KAJ9204428.1 hypothetical protein DTO032I3_2683 [Paecilomyces variotii]KAJ9279098.1 hypothetical protein DTO021D3_4135 [Paecilomyces variotii]KAJ9344396.1 hypothetical protein DTO027B6_3014 [Paecilomyces variotii]KAJ9388253.1 hypothetical protein DTO032I4_2877 [Paecilomyces variotii]